MYKITGNPVIFDTTANNNIIEMKASDVKILKIISPIITGATVTATSFDNVTITNSDILQSNVNDCDLNDCLMQESTINDCSVNDCDIAGAVVLSSTILDPSNNVAAKYLFDLGGNRIPVDVSDPAPGDVLTYAGPTGAFWDPVDIDGTTVDSLTINSSTLNNPVINNPTFSPALSLQLNPIKEIYWEENAAAMGINSLSKKRTLRYSDVGIFYNEGTSVGISVTATKAIVVAGSPYYDINDGWPYKRGGVLLYEQDDTNFTEYPPYEGLTNTSNRFFNNSGVWSGVSNDGNTVFYSDGFVFSGGTPTLMVFKRPNAATPYDIVTPQFVTGGLMCTSMFNNTFITCLTTGVIRIYERANAGVAFAQVATPDATVTGTLYPNLKMISDTLCCYVKAGILVFWEKTGGVWAFSPSQGSSVPGLQQFCCSSTMYAWSSYTSMEVRNLFGSPFIYYSIPLTTVSALTCNTTRLFVSDSSGLSIYRVSSGSMIKDVIVTAEPATGNMLACNETHLIIGRPTDSAPIGRVYKYDITNITSVAKTNEVILDEATGFDSLIKSNYGNIKMRALGVDVDCEEGTFDILADVTIDGGFEKDSKLSLGGWTMTTNNALVAGPDFKFSHNGTNFFRFNNNIVETTNRFRGPFGTSALPTYSFQQSPDTGMYTSSYASTGYEILSLVSNASANIFSVMPTAAGYNLATIYMGSTPGTLYGESATVHIGTTGDPGRVPLIIKRDPALNGAIFGSMIQFRNSSGSGVGYIASSNSATQYLTSSDYRLKDEVGEIDDGLEIIEQLRPIYYRWKSDSTNTITSGFIAHEVGELVSDAVNGEKDAVYEDGSIRSQSLDHSKLIAHLVAAVKELSVIVKQQGEEITLLKNSL